MTFKLYILCVLWGTLLGVVAADILLLNNAPWCFIAAFNLVLIPFFCGMLLGLYGIIRIIDSIQNVWKNK